MEKTNEECTDEPTPDPINRCRLGSRLRSRRQQQSRGHANQRQ